VIRDMATAMEEMQKEEQEGSGSSSSGGSGGGGGSKGLPRVAWLQTFFAPSRNTE